MMKTHYPEIRPYETFFLDTESEHLVYVEVSGNPAGVPVVFLHGGPCSGTKPDHRRFFNPDYYRIILFDQRGCGKSLPFGELNNNTTQDLVADMERIRNHLGISHWLVFGGSWGAALALLYAQAHTNTVLGLIVRGVFLTRQQDMDWFIHSGANRIYPERWQQLVECVPVDDRDDLVNGLWNMINSGDKFGQYQAARSWQTWNGQLALGAAFQEMPSEASEVERDHAVKQVRMELHYAINRYFLAENQILDNCHLLQEIPTTIIHGRFDLVCPMESGVSLYKAMPNAAFIVLPNAGHVAQHVEMIDALVAATDHFAEIA